MVPSYFIEMEAIPLTANGKVNKKALPEPDPVSQLTLGRDSNYVAPSNDIEMKLVQIWSSLLAIEEEKISVHHNFFELGGHSLKVTAMMSRIHKELDTKIPMKEIFKNPSINGLAGLIKKSAVNKFVQIKVVYNIIFVLIQVRG